MADRLSEGVKKQLLIFAGLGPLLGAIVTSVLVLPLAQLIEGYELHPLHLLWPLKVMPLPYFIGIVPALLTGLVDWQLRHIRFYVILTVLAGALLSAPALWFFVPFSIWGKLAAILAVGGIPAGICSWLSTRWMPE